ncbi:hypothetical protein H4219_003809 [Mycoemilia scoparia]|uniref:xanthine dehydrogenase n=1 Tax=Mycoemilia scoparia TaxID=417184 RepID=A0A9W7ZUI5_9FUNG|nr:hypothetical protein H4219_003809 [Mycoemilia scoparia]
MAPPSSTINSHELGSSMLVYINGKRVVINNPDPDLTVLQYLRQIGLTGTKLGCGEGGCGVCTVMVSQFDVEANQVTHVPVNACLAPLCSMDGKHIITTEGLGTAAKPHAVQERLALLHASQCGFCTPGFVMSLYTLLRNNPNPTEHEIEDCFDGNLCRCTGYRPILDAAKTFSDEAWKRQSGGSVCGRGADCCQNKKNKEQTEESSAGKKDQKEMSFAEIQKQKVIDQFKPYDPTQELIFPPQLIRYAKNSAAASSEESSDVPARVPLCITGTTRSWCKQFFRPLTFKQLVELRGTYPDSRIIGGNTEVGVEIRLKKAQYPVQIYAGDIPELRKIEEAADGSGVYFGANLTLAKFQKSLREYTQNKDLSTKTQAMSALLENLHYFAGRQIRSVATIAGNIATASPISDMNPVLVASGAKVIAVSVAGGERTIPLTEFFLGYRKTALRPDEVLFKVFVPFTRPGEVVCGYKMAKRQDDDIAIVNAGMRILVNPETGIVDEANLAYGGMGPTTVQAKKTIEAMVGKKWGSRDIYEEVLQVCRDEMKLDYAVPGGMAAYRTSLATSFLFKFWVTSSQRLGIETSESAFTEEIKDIEPTLCTNNQGYDDIPDFKVVGHGVAHMSALKQVTGEARYLDDIPIQANELYLGLILAPHAHAKIKSIDTTQALALEGVEHIYFAKDVPGHNTWGPIFQDEEFLASEEVVYFGQPIGLVLAVDQRAAQQASRLVKVDYEVLPHIVSIPDAIKADSFHPPVRQLNNGNVEESFAKSKHIFEGESYCDGQEHFYLETQGCLVIPRGEGDEYEVWSSTQNPTETQAVVSEILDIPRNRVVARIKRMGGGFGGKESRASALAALVALGSHLSKRPVRIQLDRDEDMQISGQRHAFYATWKIGCDENGKIDALEMNLFGNAGHSLDLSTGVLERAVSHADNCYNFPNSRIVGKLCKTHTQSNTAFRGFGGPQGMILIENAFEEIADRLNIPVEVLRQRNFYKEGQNTPFHQPVLDWHIPNMWDQIMKSSDFVERKKAIDEFNAKSRYRKRGISILPTKFGISFGAKFMNQAGALVHIYQDGSILVSHGGTEMGQGLHTKMCQIAAEALEVPLDSVFVSDTSTNVVANTSPTAASASSDLNGYAVYNACMILKERLAPLREKMAGEPFSKICRAAHLERINLSANGFYSTPDIGFNWQTEEGHLFFYFTQGIAVTEVELDTLTGNHTILRSDILMDVGKSLNKAIDLGQIEGAFVQGAGWSTMEEWLYHPRNGALFTRGPGNYKVPTAHTIPRDFRVSLLEGADYPNLKTIHSSKGIGEPPLFLGSSALFALRHAVTAARKGNQIDVAAEPVHLDSPATAETLRLACADTLATQNYITKEQMEGKLPFTVRI